VEQPIVHAKFHLHQCNMSPLGGENPTVLLLNNSVILTVWLQAKRHYVSQAPNSQNFRNKPNNSCSETVRNGQKRWAWTACETDDMTAWYLQGQYRWWSVRNCSGKGRVHWRWLSLE